VPVLGFSNQTNAHIELGSTNSMYYSEFVICCKDKYLDLKIGIDYPGDSLIECDSGSVILRAYDTINSHVEFPNGTCYAYKICFYHPNASVVCGINGNYEAYLVRLFSDTNSHAAFQNYTSYTYLIGCNLSYKDGTICDEDRNCLSWNCAPNIENTTKACAPSGYCYNNGNFYSHGECVENHLCWDEAWVGEGDFNEPACYCVTSDNATWINETCCGDDAGEHLVTRKYNYDYDLYIDESEKKKGESIIGAYLISKKCFADYCIFPSDTYVLVNNTNKSYSEISLGFFASPEIIGRILSIGDDLNVSRADNTTITIRIRNYQNVFNYTDWSLFLLVYNGTHLKIFGNKKLLDLHEFGSFESISGPLTIYNKTDELFLIERAISDSEASDFLSYYDERRCASEDYCIWSGVLYPEGYELNNYTCDGRFWDKIPTLHAWADPTLIVLEQENTTKIFIETQDDDAREDWSNASILFDNGTFVGNVDLSAQYGRKKTIFNGSFTFAAPGYYDLKVTYGDKVANKTKIYDKIIYVAKTAGLVRRIEYVPTFVRIGAIVKAYIYYRNDEFDLPVGTEFSLDFQGRNYEVLEKYILESDLPNGTEIVLEFPVRVLEEELLQNVIPIVRYNFTKDSEKHYYAVIPKVVVFNITLNKRIFYIGDKLLLHAIPYLYKRERIYGVNTTITIYNSEYLPVMKVPLGTIDEVSYELDTSNLDCDTYVLELSGIYGEHYGKTADIFVVTGCYP